MDGHFEYNENRLENWFFKFKDQSPELSYFFQTVLSTSGELSEIDEKQTPLEELSKEAQSNFSLDLKYNFIKELGQENNHSAAVFVRQESYLKFFVSAFSYNQLPFQPFQIQFRNYFFSCDYFLHIQNNKELFFQLGQIVNQVMDHFEQMLFETTQQKGDCFGASLDLVDKIFTEKKDEFSKIADLGAKELCLHRDDDKKLIYFKAKDKHEECNSEAAKREIISFRLDG